ncbi:MAG: lytic transglycosylase domain-containing protein [Roseibium sp.]
MLRSFTKLTGALCLFAFATTTATPFATAASSGSDPILHVIDPEKMKENSEKIAAREEVGSGSKPILHVVKPEKDTTKKKAKTSAPKKASTAKAKTASKTNVKKAAQTKSKARTKSAQAKNTSAKKDDFSRLIRKAATKHGVPVKIAKAVVQVESNFNPRARGRAGEVGLMQIKPATARGIGYRGSAKALYDPETNIEWGMKYLAGAHERANGDLCGTILRYNAGHYAKRMNPVSRKYCSKVKRIMSSS